MGDVCAACNGYERMREEATSDGERKERMNTRMIRRHEEERRKRKRLGYKYRNK